MSKHTRPLRSDLANVRGLGAAKDGTSHWWWQRLTAIALIPLLVWFVSSLVHTLILADRAVVAEWFDSSGITIAMIAMVTAMFFHARLGLQVVIEDYASRKGNKIALLILNDFLFILLGIISILSIIKLHFYGI